MIKIAGLALLILGAVLMFIGISATSSLGSDLSRFFTGSPTNKSVWMLIGGLAALIVGLGMTLRNVKHA